MEMVELKMKIINDNNPYLIITPDRSVNHPSIRKYSNDPFK